MNAVSEPRLLPLRGDNEEPRSDDDRVDIVELFVRFVVRYLAKME
jgi:hypothetical protein